MGGRAVRAGGGLAVVRVGRKGIQRQWSCAIREYGEVLE